MAHLDIHEALAATELAPGLVPTTDMPVHPRARRTMPVAELYNGFLGDSIVQSGEESEPDSPLKASFALHATAMPCSTSPRTRTLSKAPKCTTA